MKQLNVKMDDKEFEALDNYCRINSKNRSAVVRSCIRDLVKEGTGITEKDTELLSELKGEPDDRPSTDPTGTDGTAPLL